MSDASVIISDKSNQKSSKKLYIVLIFMSLLLIGLIIFCAIQSFSFGEQRRADVMKYHIMNLVYCVEKDKQLTGQLPDMNQFNRKYSDKLWTKEGYIEYRTFDGKKGYEIQGNAKYATTLVFNSEFSELGVVRPFKISKDGKERWFPDYDEEKR